MDKYKIAKELYNYSDTHIDGDLTKKDCELIVDFLNMKTEPELNTRRELIKFFNWYKQSSFSSSGKTEDLIDMYLGYPNITATSAVGGQTGT